MNPFDVIGPVMVGPSSSHTAGAVRLGRMARAIAGGKPVAARIGLHGSFARTYKGHGTDVAVVAGLLGMDMDDEAIPCALSIAAERGLRVTFETVDLDGVHPNTAVIRVTNDAGATTEITGSSLGGGRIVVTSLDGFSVSLTGTYPTWIVHHLDRPGVVASVAGALAAKNVNIGGMTVSRKRKGSLATSIIEVDQAGPGDLMESLMVLPNVTGVRYIEPNAL
ncbi:MAG: L-serine ammonia-lyase, iron-sulfur-dependent, subunit beta [Firmicutes bacterium]|nr:L-serine ammonia-lyase, iron-sulfur-dependent, subunit beta [Bacillota bacterium]